MFGGNYTNNRSARHSKKQKWIPKYTGIIVFISKIISIQP